MGRGMGGEKGGIEEEYGQRTTEWMGRTEE